MLPAVMVILLKAFAPAGASILKMMESPLVTLAEVTSAPPFTVKVGVPAVAVTERVWVAPDDIPAITTAEEDCREEPAT
jgi:hypothetical protein